MRSEPRPIAGTWLVIALVTAGLGWTAWMRIHRVPAPLSGPRGPAPRPVALPDMRIDLNTATAAELEVLPGVGPRLAERIVADRRAYDRFASIDDLSRVPGVGGRLVERIRPYAVASGG